MSNFLSKRVKVTNQKSLYFGMEGICTFEDCNLIDVIIDNGHTVTFLWKDSLELVKNQPEVKTEIDEIEIELTY